MNLKLAAVQLACEPFAVDLNLERARIGIERAAHQGAQLILLPELFHVGYQYDRRLIDFGEQIGEQTTQWMRRCSWETNAHIAGCIIERHDHRIFDTFVLSTPTGELFTYRKRYPAFFEKLYFSRGRAEGVFHTSIGRIGVMVCWDMVQPRLANELADRIDILLVSAAWPNLLTGNLAIPGFQSWMATQVSRRPFHLAQKLGVPTVFSNMTGSFQTPIPGFGIQYRSQFAGGSLIADESGFVMESLSSEVGTIVASVRSPAYSSWLANAA